MEDGKALLPAGDRVISELPRIVEVDLKQRHR
jgi:hypothetical protein